MGNMPNDFYQIQWQFIKSSNYTIIDRFIFDRHSVYMQMNLGKKADHLKDASPPDHSIMVSCVIFDTSALVYLLSRLLHL